MEHPTAGVIPEPATKSTDELQQDMQQTRDSLTEKVAALESQVMGTIQNAADTVTSTVDAVKEAVTGTPAAVSETVKQTVDAVKQTFHDTVGSFSVGGIVKKNPWASLGSSLFAGFLVGYRTGGRREVPMNYGARVAPQPVAAPAAPRPDEPPGLVAELCNMMSKEVRELAEQSLSSLLRSLKQSIGNRVPEVVDSAVHSVADRIQNATTPSRNHAYASNNSI